MIQVRVDISMFTPDEAIGMASGPVEVPVVPQVGDSVAFKGFGPNQAFLGENKLPFSGMLRVTHRIILADGDCEVILELEDITASTRQEAESLLKLFEQNHQLFVDVWEV